MQTKIRLSCESSIIHQGKKLEEKELILPKLPTLLYIVENLDDSIFVRLKKIIDTGIRVVVITCDYQNLVAKDNVYYIVVNKNELSAEKIELYNVALVAYYGSLGVDVANELVNKNTKLRMIYGVEDIPYTTLQESRPREARDKVIGIISLNGIGDSVMLIPTIKALYDKGYEVDIAVKFTEIFDGIKVRNIFTDPNAIATRDNRYEKVCDITYKLSNYDLPVNKQHRVHAIAECCGLKKNEVGQTYLPVTEEENKKGKELLRFDQSQKKKVGVCFEACDDRRALPLGQQKLLIEALAKEIKADIFILGTDIRGIKSSAVVDLRGQTTVRELIGVVNNLDLLISVDTGVFHIAGALQVPNILLNNLIPCEWRRYTTTQCHKFGQTDKIIESAKEILKRDKVENQLPEKKKVLICRWNVGLGDILIVTSALKSLRAYYPNHEIIFGCAKEYKCILENNPYIDRVVTDEALARRKDDYDKIYNLSDFFEHNRYPMDKWPATGKSRIDLMYEDCLKIPAVDRLPEYFITEDETDWAKDWLKDRRRGKRLVGFHIDSNAIARNYPLDYFEQVSDMLIHHGIDVVLVGAKVGKQSLVPYHELKKFGLINATGLTIRETAAVLNECDEIVCVDSGILHLCAALKKKIVALFGTIRPMNRILYYENCNEIFPAGEIDCVPCNDSLFIKKCKDVCIDLCYRRQPTLCMWRLTPDKVYTKVLLDLGIWKLKDEDDRPKLSFAMMTHNEEQWIEKCLDAIHDIADEIVIVDDSTDNTRKLLKKYSKVKVYDVEELPCPKECNYCKENRVDIKKIGRPCSAKLRQQSFDKCTGDWIFRIDADEIIRKEDAQKLRMLVDYVDVIYPKVKVFWFPMVNFYLDDSHYKVGAQGHTWFPDSHKRLHKNEKRFHRWIQPAHERMVDYSDKGELRYLDDARAFPFQTHSNWIMIYHYGYLQPKKTRVVDAEKYKSMKVLLHTLDDKQVEPWFLSKPDIVLPEGWGTGTCEYKEGEKG